MRRIKTIVFCTAFFLMLLTPFIQVAYADPDPSTPETGIVEEEYTGVSRIDASLEFSAGNAVCGGEVRLRSSYTASVTMQLRKNGVVTNTWYYNGSSGEFMRFSELYGAVSGNTYQVVVKATVYDASNVVVCRATATTAVKTCP